MIETKIQNDIGILKNISRFFLIKSIMILNNTPKKFYKNYLLYDAKIKIDEEQITTTHYYKFTINIKDTSFEYKLTKNPKFVGDNIYYLFKKNNIIKDLESKSLYYEDFIIDYFLNFHSLSVEIRDKKTFKALFTGANISNYKVETLPIEIKLFDKLSLKDNFVVYEAPNHLTFSELIYESFKND